MNILKKITAALICAVGLSALWSVNAQGVVNVLLDGERIDCESYGQGAVIVESRTLVPMRAVFEALGAEVSWDDSIKTAYAKRLDTEITVAVGSTVMTVKGQERIIDVPAKLVNDRTLVPVRAVAEAFGVRVGWSEKSQSVYLSTDGYERGITAGNTYYGRWTGIDFSLPEGCYFLKDEEFTGQEVPEAYLGAEEIFYCVPELVYEFSAYDQSGNSVELAVEKNKENISAKAYLENALSVYEEIGAEYKLSGIYESSLACMPVLCADVYTYFSDVDVLQFVAVYEKEDRLVSVIVSCREREDFERLIAGFSHYSEPENTQIPPVTEPDSQSTFGNSVAENETEQSANKIPQRKRQKYHAYGEFLLGMTADEIKKAAEGNVKTAKNSCELLDFGNEFSDEDEKITGSINCDYISFTLLDGLCERVYVTTEYTDADSAVEVMKNIMDYYGSSFTEDVNGNFCWTPSAKVCVISGIVRENANGKYYCFVDIRMVK